MNSEKQFTGEVDTALLWKALETAPPAIQDAWKRDFWAELQKFTWSLKSHYEAEMNKVTVIGGTVEKVLFSEARVLTTEQVAERLNMPIDDARQWLIDNGIRSYGKTPHDNNHVLYGGDDDGRYTQSWDVIAIENTLDSLNALK